MQVMQWPLLDKSNAIVGMFHHNTSSSILSRGSAKFFAGRIEARHTHEEKKQLRHNPYIDLWQHRPNLLRRSRRSFRPETMKSTRPTFKQKISKHSGIIESKVNLNRKFSNEYKLADIHGQARVLGRGGYSCVHLGWHIPSAQHYAIKVVTKRYLLECDIDNVRREVSIHRGLNHANVVRFVEHFEDGDAMRLVVEHCEGGDLQRYMQRSGGSQTLSEKAAINVFRHIVKAVAYVHQQGIIHGDIKPENVLLTKDPFSVVKLCDFGLSRNATDVRYFRHTGSVSKVPFENQVGTMGYVAPEMYKSQHFGQAIDMWALGIMLFRCLVGYAPFFPAAKCAMETLKFNETDWEGFSDQCQDFVRNLLHPNPNDRLTAMAALSHPWILDIQSL